MKHIFYRSNPLAHSRLFFCLSSGGGGRSGQPPLTVAALRSAPPLKGWELEITMLFVFPFLLRMFWTKIAKPNSNLRTNPPPSAAGELEGAYNRQPMNPPHQIDNFRVGVFYLPEARLYCRSQCFTTTYFNSSR